MGPVRRPGRTVTARRRTKGSLAAWKALSPSERASLMAKLVRAHEIGMRKFAACRAAGRDDCVKPLPPGLAKRS